MLAVLRGHAQADVIAADRDVENAANQEGLVVARVGAQRSAQFTGRLVGNDVDCAAGSVAAEQGALRPAQHFDALDVDHVEGPAGRTGKVDAVDIGADRLVDRHQAVGRALAAHEDGGRAGLGHGAGEVEVRGGRLQLGHAHDLLLFKVRAGKGADGNRGGLQAFLGLARSDDDVGNAGLVILCLSLSENRTRQCRAERQGKQRLAGDG